MTSHPRGDVKLTLLDKEYVLIPNFKAIAAIQSATGLGLGEIVKALGLRNSDQLRLDVVAQVLIQAVLASTGTLLDLDEVGEAVTEDVMKDGQPLIAASYLFILPYFGKKKEPAEKKQPKAKA